MFLQERALGTRRLQSAFSALVAGAILQPAIGNAEQAASPASEIVAAESAVEFDVYLPLRNRPELEKLLDGLHDPQSASFHRWLTPAQFTTRFGADPDAVRRVSNQLGAAGFRLIQSEGGHLHFSGTAQAVERTFGTRLSLARLANGRSAATASAGLTLPSALAAAGAVVPSFNRVARMHSNALKLGKVDPTNRYGATGPYWFDDLKQAYSYPSYTSLTGKGVTIAVLMSGDYNPSDMVNYFSHENLAVPKIQRVQVFGGAPYDPFTSLETHLDIQQSGGMAPGSTIVLYNVPDLSDQSLLAGLIEIIESNRADVVNMSFGGGEYGYLSAAYPFNNGVSQRGILQVYDDLFAQGNAQGITFVASSGDLGAREIPAPKCFDADADETCGGFVLTPSFPASSPHVTGVGGTNLFTTSDPKNPKDLNSAYVRERAYGDPLAFDIFYGTPALGGYWGSGGGISAKFAKPSYQNLVHTPSSRFRTSPDLSLHMGGCPNGAAAGLACAATRSADAVALGGNFYAVIGTSASSPDFAGLVALQIQRFGTRFGNENYTIYSLAAQQAAGQPLKPFRTNIPGNNGYPATPGYNLVLGNGTLYGTRFLMAPTMPVAGVPQTPSNP